MESDKKQEDWREGLEEYKDDPALRTFKSVKDLAESHISLNKAFSGSIQSVEKDEDLSILTQKASKFFRIPENREDYQLDVKENVDELRTLGHKYKIHPRQLKSFIEDYRKTLEKNEKNLSEAERDKYKRESSEALKDIKNRDELIAKAANKSGYSVDELKQSLGNKYYTKSVQKLLLNLGKHLGGGDERVDEKPPISSSGSDGDSRSEMQEKLNFVDYHTRNSKSPYYDSKHEKHPEIFRKVEKYSNDLKEYSKKTGEEINFT